MLYQAYEVASEAARWTRAAGAIVSATAEPWLASERPPYGASVTGALGAMWGRAGFTHARPAFGVDAIRVGNRDVPIVERTAMETPFGALTHFQKDMAAPQPKVLVVAPLSGHFATLLRGTVSTMLADHDVYLTDWANARDVPLSAGPFGFDDYVDHLVTFMRHLGPGSHMVAVCQPTVQALAATALMAETRDEAAPASITLMAGPIDTSVDPTKVNELAASKPISWFEDNLIATVPWPHAGAGRRVYPGFVQLLAFMSMNAGRHMNGHLDLFWRLVNGELEQAKQITTFYDEYFAVLDLAAEFYLETVKTVFQDNDLASNRLLYRGRPLDMRAIRKTALLTVEGERDDICSPGQTMAAQELCASVRPYMKRHHLQPGVGHYGVFSGRKWQTQVYPIVRNFVLSNA